MKKILTALILCSLLCAFLFAACKKKEPAPTETHTSAVTETGSAATTGKEETSSTAQDVSTADETRAEPAPTEEETEGEEEDSEANNTAKEFLGEYRNSDYTARVEQAPDGELTFTVTSAPDDGVGYEWTITGFYSGDTYRVNYKDAVKTEISYDEDGEETDRETVYENGIGRMQFTDDGALLWQNETEAAGGRVVLTRIEG